MGWENAAEFKKKAEEWENKIIKMNANETKDSVDKSVIYAPDFNDFIKAGGTLRIANRDIGLMHHKFCVVDDTVIMTGSYTVEDMRSLTIECLKWILTQTEVPATRPEACGNYLLHDLPMCKWESARYLDRLQNDFHSEYAKLKITLDDGKVFADAQIIAGYVSVCP